MDEEKAVQEQKDVENVGTFVLHEKQSLETQAAKALKDDELMSGRLTNNLDPVLFSPPKGAGAAAEAAPQRLTAAEATAKAEDAAKRQLTRLPEGTAEGSLDGSLLRTGTQVLKQETTSTRRLAGRDSTMGRSSAGQASLPPEVQVQRQKKGKKPPADFNKMSHYEIMEHIEGAALRQRLNKSRQKDRKPGSLPSTEEMNIMQSNAAANEKPRPPHYRSTSAFMQQAELAAEAFAKQDVGGCSINAGEQAESSMGGNTTNTHDRLERRLKGSQAALRDAVGPRDQQRDGNYPGAHRTSRKNIAYQQQYYQSKRSYKQIGFAPSTEGPTKFKDYVDSQHHPGYTPFTRTTREVKGTNTLMMSQTSQNLNRLRFARASFAAPSAHAFGPRRSAGSQFGISGSTVKQGHGVVSAGELSHGRNNETALSSKQEEPRSGEKFLSNSNTSLNRMDPGSSPGFDQYRNAFRYRGRLVHSQEQRYRMNRQGFARSSVGEIRMARRAAHSPNSPPEPKDFAGTKQLNEAAKEVPALGPDPGVPTLAPAETRQHSRPRPRYSQTTGYTTRNVLPKGLVSQAASPSFKGATSEARPPIIQPGTHIRRKASNNEDLTIPHTREMPPSSTHRSSLEAGPHQLLKEKVQNYSIKIDKLRTIINKHNPRSVAEPATITGHGSGMGSAERGRQDRAKRPSATIVGVQEVGKAGHAGVDQDGQVESAISKSLENYDKLQRSDDDSKEFGASQKHLFSSSNSKKQRRVVINRAQRPRKSVVLLQQKEYLPIQDLELAEVKADSQDIQPPELKYRSRDTAEKSPSNSREASQVLSPLASTNKFLTQRQRRNDKRNCRGFLNQHFKRNLSSQSGSPPPMSLTRQYATGKPHDSFDLRGQKNELQWQQKPQEPGQLGPCAAVQIFHLPSKGSAYIHALKQNRMRNEEMVRRYLEKTQASKEVAIQARDRNTSSMTPSQLRQKSQSSGAAVVVQYNEHRLVELNMPRQRSPINRQGKNEAEHMRRSRKAMTPMRDPAMNADLTEQAQPQNQDIGTQFDLLDAPASEKEEQPHLPTDRARREIKAHGRDSQPPHQSNASPKRGKSRSSTRQTQGGRKAGRQSQVPHDLQSHEDENESHAMVGSKMRSQERLLEQSFQSHSKDYGLFTKQKQQSHEQPQDLNIQRIQLNVVNQEKNKLQRQRASSKMLKQAEVTTQKSKSRLSCNTKYAEKENAEDAQNEDGSDTHMTPQAVSQAELIGLPSSMPNSGKQNVKSEAKGATSKASMTSSSKSVLHISGKKSKVASNHLRREQQLFVNVTELSTPPDGSSEASPSKQVPVGEQQAAERAAPEGSAPLPLSGAEKRPNDAAERAANRAYRERERQEFNSRQQELMEKRSSQDAKARQGKQVNLKLMDNQLQQLGHVSELSRRQHAVLTQSTVTEREEYLRKSIQLKGADDDVVRSRDSLSFRHAEDQEAEEGLADQQAAWRGRPGKPKKKLISVPDYQQMPLSTAMISKLQLDLELKQLNKSTNIFRGTEAQKFADILEKKEAQKPVFDKEIIQSKEDELVFQRINPHLEAQKTQENIPDPSLLALLQKNGGVPLTDKQCLELLSPKESKKKPYHMLNEFEKETRNLITGLRQEIKADTLQGTLMQYMKENREKKEQQRLTEFCQYILQLQAAKKKKQLEEQQKMARKQQKKHKKGSQSQSQGNQYPPSQEVLTSAHPSSKRLKSGQQNASAQQLAAPRAPTPGRPQSAAGRPPSAAKPSRESAKNEAELIDLRVGNYQSSCQFEEESAGAETDQQAQLAKKPTTVEVTKSMVDDYLAGQERELERLRQIEEEEKTFQQQIKTRGMLNFPRDVREGILEKLACIPALEQQQKDFAAVFKRESEARRRQQIQQNNVSEFYKLKELEKLKAIHQQIEARKTCKTKETAPARATSGNRKVSKEKVKFNLASAEGSSSSGLDDTADKRQRAEVQQTQFLDHEMGKDAAVTDKTFFRQYLRGLEERYPRARYHDRLSAQEGQLLRSSQDASQISASSPGPSGGASPAAQDSVIESTRQNKSQSKESGHVSPFRARSQTQGSPARGKQGSEVTAEVSQEFYIIEKQNVDVLSPEDLIGYAESSPAQKQTEPVLDAKRRRVENRLLDATARANSHLLQNIQHHRLRSQGRWGLKTAGGGSRPHSIGTLQKLQQITAAAIDIGSRAEFPDWKRQSTEDVQKSVLPDRNRLFQLARACQGELDHKPTKEVLRGSFAAQLRRARLGQREIMSNLERLQECMERVRPHEASDTYEDIEIETIKEELVLARKDEATAARLARAELQAAKHPRQFLRDQYIRCMQEFGY